MVVMHRPLRRENVLGISQFLSVARRSHPGVPQSTEEVRRPEGRFPPPGPCYFPRSRLRRAVVATAHAGFLRESGARAHPPCTGNSVRSKNVPGFRERRGSERRLDDILHVVSPVARRDASAGFGTGSVRQCFVSACGRKNTAGETRTAQSAPPKNSRRPG